MARGTAIAVYGKVRTHTFVPVRASRPNTAPLPDWSAATYTIEPSGLRVGDNHAGISRRFVLGFVANVQATTPADALTQNTVPAASMAPMYTKPLGPITGDA
jgi:hypothetical protein